MTGMVFSASGEQVERMRQQRQDRCERGLRTGRAAGQVDDEACADCAADGTAERRKRRMEKAVGAHSFGEAFDEPVTDQFCRLGSYIARSEAGTTRGDDQVAGRGMAAQRFGNEFDFVGQGFGEDNGSAGASEEFRNCRAGEIQLPALEAAIADGQNGGAGIDVEERRHEVQGTG